jgi:transcriptional regulator with XRE-family HTH domain
MSETPTAQRLQLGRELVVLRERAGVSRADAAQALMCSQSKISKLEHGKAALSALELQTLLRLYDVPEGSEQADQLMAIADSARKRSTLAVPDWVRAYVGLEATAAEIQTFEIDLVPGLLQTEAYTRAVAMAASASRNPREVERLVSIRRERQTRLTSDNPPQLHVILHEAALRIVVGGPAVMREQLEWLLALAELPGVTLRVLPFSAGAYASMGAGFSIVRLPGGERVVYLEKLWLADYVDKAAQVAAYTALWDSLMASALDITSTTEIIRDAIGDLR